MKILKSLLVAVALFVSASAMAVTPKVSGDIGLYSDYIWRGISQTSGGSATQANLNVDIGKWYVGASTSNVDIAGADYELDLTGGFANQIGSWDYDFGGIVYLYPNDVSDIEIDTWEVYGGGGYTFSNVNVAGKVYYSDDYFSTGTSWYTEVPVTVNSQYVSLMASMGYLNLNDAEKLNNTVDYKINTSIHITSTFDVYGQWTKLGTSTDNFKLPTDVKDGTWVGGVSYSF